MQEAVIVIDAAQRAWLFNRQAKTYFPGLAVDKQETRLVIWWGAGGISPIKLLKPISRFSNTLMHVRAVPLIQEQTELLMLFVLLFARSGGRSAGH